MALVVTQKCDLIFGQAESVRFSAWLKGNRIMTAKPLGTPLSPQAPKPISDKNKKAPGFGWTLSDSARSDIEKIEANARAAEQRSGSTILR